MAITNIPPYFWPMPLSQAGAAPNYTAMGAMNASGDRVGFVVQCPKAGTLDKFEVRIGAVTNNPDNGIRFSFQTVDVTNGNPDGTQDQYRDYVTALSGSTWTAPGLMTSDGTDGGVKRTVTRGEWIACVIDFVSFVASDSFTVSTLRTDTISLGGISYQADGSAGTYTKGATTAIPVLALKYDDGTYAQFAPDQVWPLSAINTYTFNSGSTPDEYALKFQFPAPVRVRGAWVMVDMDNNFDVVLYNSASAAQTTMAVDKDIRQGSGTLINPYYVFFDTSISLTASTNYRLAIKPGASNISVYGLACPSSSYLGSMPAGSNAVLSTRTDAGAWTDSTAEQLYAGLIIDGIDDGVSAGGSGGSFPFVG